MDDVTFEMLTSFVTDETELISIYFGADVDEDTAARFRDRVESEFTNCDVEMQFGGQPVYYYIVSVE